jgi:hypothetical protein
VKLRWADGRTEFRHIDVDFTTTTIQVLDPEGLYHTFRVTNVIENGCDVYEEEIKLNA